MGSTRCIQTAKILAFALATWGIAFVAEAHQLTPREQLGKNLFFDSDLSGQACAVCHGPRVGWTGPVRTRPSTACSVFMREPPTVPPPIFRTQDGVMLCGLVRCDYCGHPVPPGLGRASVAVLFQQPVLIVAIEVGPDGGAHLFDVLVDASEHDLLLQRTDESLGDAVGLGLANKGEAGYHAEELQLLLEVLGHEGAAVVVAQ